MPCCADGPMKPYWKSTHMVNYVYSETTSPIAKLARGLMPTSSDTLGKRIAALRERRGLLQKDLADRADLSVSFVSEIENDKRNIGTEALLRIAEVLGASLDYL